MQYDILDIDGKQLGTLQGVADPLQVMQAMQRMTCRLVAVPPQPQPLVNPIGEVKGNKKRKEKRVVVT